MTHVQTHPDEKIVMLQVHGITHTRLMEWINKNAINPKNTTFEQAINLLIDKRDEK